MGGPHNEITTSCKEVGAVTTLFRLFLQTNNFGFSTESATICTAETTSSTGSSATGAKACGTNERAGWPGPSPLQVNVFEVILDELTDSGAPIHMRNDL